MQGRLRNEALSIEIHTECGHCGEPLRLTVGSDLTLRTEASEPALLIFEPQVNWDTFADANIIDAY